jgi:hypothetical protein
VLIFSADLLGEDPAAAGLGEGVELALKVLAGGGAAGVADATADRLTMTSAVPPRVVALERDVTHGQSLVNNRFWAAGRA